MKRLIFLGLMIACSFPARAQQTDMVSMPVDSIMRMLDSVNASFRFQTGMVDLKNGVSRINVPAGFKFLDPEQSKKVLVDLWGNPPTIVTQGMLFPEKSAPLDEDSWAFNIEYEDIGYVKDDDADGIDYNELLENMKKETSEASAERLKLGYGSLRLIGWASPPYYDKEKKVLHWAKELQFDSSETHTLNYDVRVLGKKGVMSLNAIAGMNQLPDVKKAILSIVPAVTFIEGQKYSDFNPDVDEVAAWTIGGLVAGKVLAKAGFFVLLLKFWKVIAVGAVAIGAFIWKRFRGGKSEKQE